MSELPYLTFPLNNFVLYYLLNYLLLLPPEKSFGFNSKLNCFSSAILSDSLYCHGCSSFFNIVYISIFYNLIIIRSQSCISDGYFNFIYSRFNGFSGIRIAVLFYSCNLESFRDIIGSSRRNIFLKNISDLRNDIFKYYCFTISIFILTPALSSYEVLVPSALVFQPLKVYPVHLYTFLVNFVPLLETNV